MASERHVIDLRQGDNLKIIFDAGLRPWRTRALEKRECGIAHEELVSLILPNGEQVELDVGRASFDVLQGNQLSEAAFFGVTESTPHAVRRVKEICRAARLSDEGLDQIANHLGAHPDTRKRWSQAGMINNVRLWITFYPMWFRNPVEAQVWVFVQWSHGGGPMKFLSVPIKPPPGYEDVSMDEPTPVYLPTRTPPRAQSPTETPKVKR